ncbi:conjugal transfer protein TraK [Maribacter polysaccharolyticus]|uniref:conjugal transfer protein TraK n=1 Tax=Maribacter polysaccharolyticus TaxID=3020831 RepID=UPI00237F0759|nr:conjugal transfer protein TraK [Maribacter polysaccharolyticus]MDE3742108.1 conjugal transfer protein TraK [Maribacter polysaccharolyticus]
MKKTKTPYKNIYDVLDINRFIVLSVVIVCLLTSGFALSTVFRFNDRMLNSAFAVNTDGSVIPLKLVSERENMEVEALSHLDMFHRYFYGIDASNYLRNLEKALWLGNSSVDNVYRQKKADGVYNRLLQYSLVQKIKTLDTELTLSGTTMGFRSTIIFEINRGSVIDRYQLMTSGNLIKVDRNFPNNPHGLLITHFFENSLRKINNQE